MFLLADNICFYEYKVRLFLVGNRFVDSVIGKRFAFCFLTDICCQSERLCIYVRRILRDLRCFIFLHNFGEFALICVSFTDVLCIFLCVYF